MKSLINRMFLLIYCFLTFLLTKLDAAFIIVFFIALIVTSLNYYAANLRFGMISTIGYGICACFFPPLMLFFPLVAYDLAQTRNPISGLPYLFSLMLYWQTLPRFALFYLIVGMLLALYLCYHTETYQSLHREFKKNRDDSMELNLVLQEKNQSILENQNYEIYTATLRERNRIAREIHDNVGHLLSRSILMTGALKTINKEPALSPQLDMLDDTLNAAMDTIRSSVHDLHDNSVNLKESLDSLINTFDFCSISLEYDMTYELPNAVKYCFISITKESLSNIIKHSNATNVRVVVREHPSMYQLIIEDNGTQFKEDSENGIGLINMKDRVQSLNGNILFETKAGFRIFITIPKD